MKYVLTAQKVVSDSGEVISYKLGMISSDEVTITSISGFEFAQCKVVAEIGTSKVQLTLYCPTYYVADTAFDPGAALFLVNQLRVMPLLYPSLPQEGVLTPAAEWFENLIAVADEDQEDDMLEEQAVFKARVDELIHKGALAAVASPAPAPAPTPPLHVLPPPPPLENTLAMVPMSPSPYLSSPSRTEAVVYPDNALPIVSTSIVMLLLLFL